MNYFNPLIYGKDSLTNVVSCEVEDDKFIIFTEDYGKVNKYITDNENWVLASKPLADDFERLDGNLHYKYGKIYTDNNYYKKLKSKMYKYDTFFIGDDREQNLIIKGITYYKGLKPENISILSFDIETAGLVHNDSSKLLLIANTFRKNGKFTRKIFCYDDYENEGEMIKDWCSWVREIDPSILCGHNVLNFDFRYIKFIADKYNIKLNLGRDNSELEFYRKPSKFRVDGNRDQEFTNIRCWGREILDTMFLAIKYDVKKKYESYGLKQIIKQEKLEAKDRVFYDASQIKYKYNIPEEWEKIKEYCKDDSDDALNLYDKLIPAFFYIANSVPKTFQQIILTASGSQINSILVRAYLQQGHSIPKAEKELGYVEGGLSIGIPGRYKNGVKLDLKAAYPSQILRFKLFDKEKDPKAYLYKLTIFFRNNRIKIKELAQKTKDSSLKDQDEAAKAFLNSLYGVCKTPGLNFNSRYIADKITFETRKVLRLGIKWATGRKLESILDEKGLKLGRDKT